MTIRVLIAEDNALLRQGLERLLSGQDGLELVGSAASLPELLAAAAQHRPHVVVSDIRMPPGNSDEGIVAAAQLAGEQPELGVVLLSQHVEVDYAVRFLERGSARRAYLLKERVGDAAELVAAIRAVAAGGSVIDPLVVEQLVAGRAPRPDSALDRLSPREREVLGEMAQGKNNAAIAAALFLTERAVEKHTNAIFGKLGFAEEPDLNRRVAAVLMYLQRDA
ncbi:MAG TPA: response regulator transcription factor [Jatrophihabitans sp.]|nr:response regulator transcription factor [Jatrophihabitans sp.]